MPPACPFFLDSSAKDAVYHARDVSGRTNVAPAEVSKTEVCNTNALKGGHSSAFGVLDPAARAGKAVEFKVANVNQTGLRIASTV